VLHASGAGRARKAQHSSGIKPKNQHVSSISLVGHCLTLALLVAGLDLANHPNHTFAAHNFAVSAHFLHGSTYFHDFFSKLPDASGTSIVLQVCLLQHGFVLL
jgi:hypothetical protein